MTDLESVTHFIKRGKAQVLQMLGKEEKSANPEYDEERKVALKVRHVLKATNKHIEDLIAAMDAVGHCLTVVTNDFSEFTKIYEVEGSSGCEVDFLAKMVRLMQVEAEQYKETIKTNGCRILTHSIGTFDPLESLHSEMRNVQLDLDVIKKDVLALEVNISSNAKSKDKDEIALPAKQLQLSAITERHGLIIAEGRERMRVVMADGNASAWSVYGIVFRQTFQNYQDNTKLFKEIISQLTTLKNQQDSAKKLTEERTARLRSEHLQSAEVLWKASTQTVVAPTPYAAVEMNVYAVPAVATPDEFAAFGRPPGYVAPRGPQVSSPTLGVTVGVAPPSFPVPTFHAPEAAPDDFNAFN